MSIFKSLREYIEGFENTDKYIDEYIEFIKKDVGFKNTIVGHLHRFIKKDNVTIVNFYPNNYEIDGYYIIADTHITNESSIEYINNIRHDIISNSDKTVILLGDIFDLWISDGKNMRNNDVIMNLIDTINEYDVVYVRGNHDYEIEKYFDINTYERFETYDYIFYHGHQFDLFFNKNIFGRFALWVQLRFGDNISKINKYIKDKFY